MFVNIKDNNKDLFGSNVTILFNVFGPYDVAVSNKTNAVLKIGRIKWRISIYKSKELQFIYVIKDNSMAATNLT